MKRKSLIGLPLINGADGQIIGEVKELMLSKENYFVEFFMVIDQEKGKCYIVPFKQASFDKEAVTIMDRNDIIKMGNFSFNNESKYQEIIYCGKDVLNENSECIGTIIDYSFDDETTEIQEIYYYDYSTEESKSVKIENISNNVSTSVTIGGESKKTTSYFGTPEEKETVPFKKVEPEAVTIPKSKDQPKHFPKPKAEPKLKQDEPETFPENQEKDFVSYKREEFHNEDFLQDIRGDYESAILDSVGRFKLKVEHDYEKLRKSYIQTEEEIFKEIDVLTNELKSKVENLISKELKSKEEEFVNNLENNYKKVLDNIKSLKKNTDGQSETENVVEFEKKNGPIAKKNHNEDNLNNKPDNNNEMKRNVSMDKKIEIERLFGSSTSQKSTPSSDGEDENMEYDYNLELKRLFKLQGKKDRIINNINKVD